MIKRIIKAIIFPIKVTAVGLYNLCLILSKGFYFYFYLFFSLLSKIFDLKVFKIIKLFFKKLQNNPGSILLIIVIFIGYILFMKYGYSYNNKVIYIDDSKDGEETQVIKDSELSDDNKMILNLYKKYGSYEISNIDINELKTINSDIIGWIIVDGTSINYPVLKTNDNSFYLTHDFNKNYSIGGWIFMD